MADKYIFEAKASGWLVSPYRGSYYVPAAQDLSVVSWLPEPARSEFLISRTLTGAGIPYWCLSAWCRVRGLEPGAPAFVTDLGVGTKLQERGVRPLDRKAVRAATQEALDRWTNLPALDALLVVPLMPPLREPTAPKIALVPEDPRVESMRQTGRQMGSLAIGLIGLVAWAVTKEKPDFAGALEDVGNLGIEARAIPYALGPDVADQAWIAALLASIGTARMEELLGRMAAPAGPAVQRWAGLMGPPQPVAGWKDAIQRGPFPYFSRVSSARSARPVRDTPFLRGIRRRGRTRPHRRPLLPSRVCGSGHRCPAETILVPARRD